MIVAKVRLDLKVRDASPSVIAVQGHEMRGIIDRCVEYSGGSYV